MSPATVSVFFINKVINQMQLLLSKSTTLFHIFSVNFQDNFNCIVMKEKATDVIEKFAGNVARIREGKGLSLREVAAGCSLDHANIQRIEAGKVDLSLSTLVEVAKGLGVHPRRLLDFEVE